MRAETWAQLENAPSEARGTLSCGRGDVHQSSGYPLAGPDSYFEAGHRMRRILGHKHLILLNCDSGRSVREDLHEDYSSYDSKGEGENKL